VSLFARGTDDQPVDAFFEEHPEIDLLPFGLIVRGQKTWEEALVRWRGCFWATERGLLDVVEAPDANVQVAWGLWES
jgi:hypothetical protein